MRLMRFVRTAALGALVLLCTAPAQALTVSNIDPDPHTITVTAAGSSKELTVEPQKEVDAPCSEGCKVKLENGEEYELEGGDTVSIEDGVIFIDHSPDSDAEDVPNVDPDAAPEEGAAAPGDNSNPDTAASGTPAPQTSAPPPQ
jgi:hypothetical protein